MVPQRELAILWPQLIGIIIHSRGYKISIFFFSLAKPTFFNSGATFVSSAWILDCMRHGKRLTATCYPPEMREGRCLGDDVIIVERSIDPLSKPKGRPRDRVRDKDRDFDKWKE